MVEAAASGMPIVSTAMAGASDIVIDGQTGCLSLIDDHVRLAENILRLLRDPDTAKRMGRAGQSHVLQRFDYERNMNAIIQMYREVVEKRRL
jgi:glycosyltransferase involved in cell wall biosynthesis